MDVTCPLPQISHQAGSVVPKAQLIPDGGAQGEVQFYQVILGQSREGVQCVPRNDLYEKIQGIRDRGRILVRMWRVDIAGHGDSLAPMSLFRSLILPLILLCLPACGNSGIDHASLIRPLIDPAKLATLGERGANSRVQKVTAILWQAKQEQQDPEKVAQRAVEMIGWGGTGKGRITSEAMVRNLTIAERLGATTREDISEMSRGRVAKVRTGPYTGQILSVDHIIPRAVAPELDNVIANLELMPLSLNEGKGATITSRQVDLARKLSAEGLLSEDGLKRIQAAAK